MPIPKEVQDYVEELSPAPRIPARRLSREAPKDEVAELRAQVADLQGKLAAANRDYSRVLSKLQTAEKTLNEGRARELYAENARLQAQVSEQQARLEAEYAQHAQTAQQAQHLSAELAAEREQHERLKKTCDGLRARAERPVDGRPLTPRMVPDTRTLAERARRTTHYVPISVPVLQRHLKEAKREAEEAKKRFSDHLCGGCVSHEEHHRALDSLSHRNRQDFSRTEEKYEKELARLAKRLLLKGMTYQPLHVVPKWYTPEWNTLHQRPDAPA